MPTPAVVVSHETRSISIPDGSIIRSDPPELLSVMSAIDIVDSHVAVGTALAVVAQDPITACWDADPIGDHVSRATGVFDHQPLQLDSLVGWIEQLEPFTRRIRIPLPGWP